MQKNSEENRSYSRVATRFYARYRKLKHPDEPQLCPMGFVADPSDNQRFLRESGLPQALCSFLINLDAKLDRIITHMHKDSLQADFPEQLLVLDVSAAGLLVQSEDIKPGDYLELVLFLGEFPPLTVSGVAKVLRQGNISPDNKKTYALEFTRLRESEHEEIIRFVFKENRARIRTERLK